MRSTEWTYLSLILVMYFSICSWNFIMTTCRGLWPISQTINYVKACAPHNLIQDSHESIRFIALDIISFERAKLHPYTEPITYFSYGCHFFRLLKFYTDHILWSTTHSMNNRLCIVSFNLRTMHPFDPPGKRPGKTWKQYAAQRKEAANQRLLQMMR